MKYHTILDKTVELTDERKLHIFQRHADVIDHFAKIKQVLRSPDEIRIDTQDANVLLFYKHFGTIGNGKYLVVVVKVNTRNFILTCYTTHRIKSGELYERKKTA